MSRPLVISDCDEVLLHMLLPWRDWAAEMQGIAFSLDRQDFSKSMHYVATGDLVSTEETWRLLELFFTHEMDRQYPIAGAIAAMRTLGEHADVVVLTNLADVHQEARTRQLLGHGLDIRVFTNQGPKGPALQRILDEFQPSQAVFIDDIAQHHSSVAELAPEVHRLHFCGEPTIAPLIRCAHQAGHAHARIDDWSGALPWLLARLHGENDD